MKKIMLSLVGFLFACALPVAAQTATPSGQIVEVVTTSTVLPSTSASANNQPVGTAIQFNVVVGGSPTIAPTGTVAFVAVNGATTVTLGTCTLAPVTGSTAASNCSITYSFTAPGSYTVTPNYSGDANFAPAN